MTEKTIEFGEDLVAHIVPDGDVEQPYDGDDSVRIVVLHGRYSDPSKGECGKTPEEVERWAKENAREWYVVPLWMYDHSGTAYGVGEQNPFTCPWDSGRVGIVALRKDEWGKGRGELDSTRFEYAKGVAQAYTSWANGDCWGYVLKDAEGIEIDSCFGFIGMDSVEEAAREAAEFYMAPAEPENGEGTRPSI